MPLSYQEAFDLVAGIAKKRYEVLRQHYDVLPLNKALGRTAVCDISSPLDTPTFASSAMDGYAVISSQLSEASADHPLRLRVLGTMAAGDVPLSIDDQLIRGGLFPCVEIMTGAAFPFLTSGQATFDACIPWEYVRKIGEDLIEIIHAPARGANKRPVGGDFRKGDIIVAQGESIASQHVMALASVGVKEVSVVRKMRVGVLSTGSELIPLESEAAASALMHRIHESNGPYLMAALHELGVEAKQLGCVADDTGQLIFSLEQEVDSGDLDLLITTGGVSSGKFDHMPSCIKKVGGQVQFHHVAMRPGHPCLFATFSNSQSEGVGSGVQTNGTTRTNGVSNGHTALHRRTAIFALPGNPIASACCFRFLVTPYIRQLTGVPPIRAAMSAKVAGTSKSPQSYTNPRDPGNFLVAGSSDFDVFRHGTLHLNENGWLEVVPREKSPSKTGPFVGSNCWIHIVRGNQGLWNGSIASVYPFSSCEILPR